MSDEYELDPKSFAKQRRNLIIISVVLTTIVMLKLDLPDQIHFFGNTIRLGNPERAQLVLWGVWLYCLVRYIGFHGQYQTSKEKLSFEFNQVKSRYHARPVRRTAVKRGMTAADDSFQLSSFTRCKPLSYKATGFIYRNKDGPGGIRREDVEIDIPLWSAWLADVRAWSHVLFRYAPTSEYYLPYVVAALPVLASAYLG